MDKEVKIPDIAENVDTGLIASVLVEEGDEVKADQPLVEVETDKATTDIPSDYDGKVKEVKVSEGDEVKVNQVIMILEVSGEGEDEEKEEDPDTDESEEKTEKKDKETDREKEEEEKDKKSEKETEKKEEEEGDADEKKAEDKEEDRKEEIPASPLARRIAREHSVDISKIKGTGPGDRVSRSDVESYIASKEEDQEKEKDVARFEEERSIGAQRKAMSTIDKITAKTMEEAWRTIPHVTQFDEADITELEKFRKDKQEKVQKSGGKLTVTAILLKLSAFALQKFPRFNSSIDREKEEIIYKNNYDVSIAVDTPQGLLVPVVRDVHRKSLTELSAELTELSEKARNKKISPDEMQGGNFTISNLGGIGGTAFTPIVYPPQVAILGVSRARQELRPMNDDFEQRLIMPLSLSYDHRVINGADGARFLSWFCKVLEDPYTLFF